TGATSPDSPAKQDSLTSDQAGLLSPSTGVSRYSDPGSKVESSDSATPPPASSPAPEAGKVGPGVVPASLNGQIAPAAPSPVDGAPQKTEEKNRQVEDDKVSQTTEIAQNRFQQNQQNEQPSNQERAKTPGAAGQSEEKRLAKEQSPAPPGQVSTAQVDKEAPTKGGDRAAALEQISPSDARTLPDDNNKKVSVLRNGIATETRAKEGRATTIRPKDSEPPRTESTHDEKERHIA